MALTPEEVVNKRFQPTKFREGYDQDEVDDFLDEVVNEIRRLNAENDELRQKLAACERRVGELTRAGAKEGSGDSEKAPETSPKPAVSAPASAAEPAPKSPSAPAADPAPAPAAVPAVAAAAVGAAGSQQGPEAAAGMLQLAQKLHDDYVRAGEEQRDKIVSEAKEHATRLVSEAEEKQRQTLGSLEQERSLLERKIDQLRAFEREYRSRLKSYLEGQLRDLESRGTVLPSSGGKGGQEGVALGESGGGAS
jgi:DivIVA domain-containing protein